MIDPLVPFGLGLDAGAAVTLTGLLIDDPESILQRATFRTSGLALVPEKLKTLCVDREAGKAAGICLGTGFAAQIVGQSGVTGWTVPESWTLALGGAAALLAWISGKMWSTPKGDQLFQRLRNERAEQMAKHGAPQAPDS